MKKVIVVNNNQICISCNKLKSLSEFPANHNYKSGHSTKCLECINFILNNNIDVEQLIFNKKCKECKKNKKSNEFHTYAYAKDGKRNKCILCIQNQRKKYSKSESGKEKSRLFASKRRENLLYKLHAACNTNIHYYLKLQKSSKNNLSLSNYLPYTIEELKNHLESLWESWMTWDNYGKASTIKKTWQIDHIIPSSILRYDSLEHTNFKKCWSLENLRPLESIENIKKYNKLIGI